MEFALVLPLLLAIASGITYYGYAYVLKSAVESASRAGAEQAVAVSPLLGADYAAVQEAQVQQAVARSLDWLPSRVIEAVTVQAKAACALDGGYGVRVRLPLTGEGSDVLPGVSLGRFRVPPLPVALESLTCVVI
ncbi:TadE family protein [Salinisphaera dokdonensis]|uniref:TadE family protein n=1 Tax=Salinisphaera dokdonensis TaxID=454598 RepID=UPI00333F1489